MLGLGSLIAGGIGLAGTLFGASKSAKENRRMQKDVERQRKENQDWFNSRYYQDPMERADAQAAITRTRELLARRARNAQGRQAVMGGTEQSADAERQAASKAIGDVNAQIAIEGENDKDRVLNQYQSRKQGYDNQLNQIRAQKVSNIATAAQGVAGAAAQIGNVFDLAAQAKADAKKESTVKPTI